MKVKKTNRTKFTGVDENRLVENAFPYVFQGARISTSNGTEIEQNKYVGPISTILRLLTHKDGDLSTYFDNIDETRTGIVNTSFKHLLFINHTNDDNKCKIKGHLTLEHIFGFCKMFKKISRSWIRSTFKNINIRTQLNLHNNGR